MREAQRNAPYASAFSIGAFRFLHAPYGCASRLVLLRFKRNPCESGNAVSKFFRFGMTNSTANNK